MAISTLVTLPPSSRRRAIGYPPAAATQSTSGTPISSALAWAASSINSASARVSWATVRMGLHSGRRQDQRPYTVSSRPRRVQAELPFLFGGFGGRPSGGLFDPGFVETAQELFRRLLDVASGHGL